MTKTDSEVILSDKEDTIFEVDIVMESPPTFETQKQRMKNFPRLRTTSYPEVTKIGRKEARERKTSQAAEGKWAKEDKEDDNGMTALEVVEEHFQMRRKQFQMEQERKKAEFLEQQLKEKTEFEALLSELKVKHIRTLQAIESRAKRDSAYDSDDSEGNADSDTTEDEEDDQENDNKSDIIVNTVISDLECPRCRQVMKPPVSIWRCEVGHLLCGHCRANQSSNYKSNRHSHSSDDSLSSQDEDSLSGIDEETQSRQDKDNHSSQEEDCENSPSGEFEYSRSEDSLWSLEGDSSRTLCPSCNAETWTAGVRHRTGQIVARAVHIEKIASTLFANQ